MKPYRNHEHYCERCGRFAGESENCDDDTNHVAEICDNCMNKRNNYYKPIPVGHNLFISHKDACGTDFPLEQTLHIFRDDIPDYSCDMIKRGQSFGLVINYKDGESLTKIDIPYWKIDDFLAGTEPRLIHCTAGQTRSPTIAILGKLIRGATLSQAIGDVVEANWKLRGVACNLCLTPLQEILQRS